MKRNPLNSLVLALAVPLLVAGFAGCKKKEAPPRSQLTPMPQRPPQAAAPVQPGAPPQPGTPPQPGAAPHVGVPAQPGAPAQAVAPQPGAAAPAGAAKPGQLPLGAVQKQASSAYRPAPTLSQLDFRNRTDPFRPYVVEPPPQPKAEQALARREGEQLPIQSYDVAKFKVVGIIAGLRENKALIVDPAGKGYVVQAGMPLGSNEGRITRITATGVEVVETYKEGKGHVKKRKIVLTLAKKR